MGKMAESPKLIGGTVLVSNFPQKQVKVEDEAAIEGLLRKTKLKTLIFFQCAALGDK